MEPVLSDSLTDSLDRNPKLIDGSQITMQEAIDWTKTYQSNHEEQLKAIYFSADVFQTLLKQPGADGIRIYNATNADGKDCFVLVGATVTGDLTEGKSVAYDKGRCCPSECIASPLNHK